MRTIHLFRHAKSSRDDPALADQDRPLNARGRAAAATMAQRLQQAGLRPRLVLCSSARRTRETLSHLAPALGGAEVALEQGLYEASETDLLSRLRALPDAIADVMIIGHNPGLERLAAKLIGPGGDAHAEALLAEKFPTAAVVTLHCDLATWSALAPRSCRLAAFMRPNDV